jgi:hypothetical protein
MRISNSISELRQQIYRDLRIQHPDWVELNGECPRCDVYVARLMEELSMAEGTSEAFGGWAHRDSSSACPRATIVRDAAIRVYDAVGNVV